MSQRFTLALWLVLGCVRSATAAPPPDDPQVYPVFIAWGSGFGSGCYLAISNSVYLATAKHVLFDLNANPPVLTTTNAILQTYYPDETGNLVPAKYLVDFALLNRDGAVRTSTNHDVALVKLFKMLPANRINAPTLVQNPGVHELGTNYRVTSFKADSFAQKNDVRTGCDIFMFGYPAAITVPSQTDLSPDQPLLRKGIVSGKNTKAGLII
ncbi:MAG TPA: hypothetical protein VMB21_13210, partial [Candidatus Limnocylindria bacterium]|nr:hypothetical protein [Candidatus Limnocylindria bacterium]